jgi:HPr kinase/phosphorylase
MKVTVKDLAEVSAAVLAGVSGFGREIASPHMTTPDLSATASGKRVRSALVHVRPEQIAFLNSLPKDERSRLVRVLLKQNPAGIVVSGRAVCRELLDGAEAAKITVLKSRDISKLDRFLAAKLTPRISLHGVLVQIFSLGTLIIGESAVGKSEAALDLVLRGHKLVADDMVVLTKTDGEIHGAPTELGANLLQIRGLGVIDIRALYGESATASSSRVGLVVELEEWRKGQQYSLVGLREKRFRLLGTRVPYLKFPVKPGRNMSTLIEVAVRNQMLKNKGIFTARELDKKLRKRLEG